MKSAVMRSALYLLCTTQILSSWAMQDTATKESDRSPQSKQAQSRLTKGSIRSFSTLVEQMLNKEDQSTWVATFSPLLSDLLKEKDFLKLEAISALLTKKVDIFTATTAQGFLDVFSKLFKEYKNFFTTPAAPKTQELYIRLVLRCTPGLEHSTLNAPAVYKIIYLRKKAEKKHRRQEALKNYQAAYEEFARAQKKLERSSKNFNEKLQDYRARQISKEYKREISAIKADVVSDETLDLDVCVKMNLPRCFASHFEELTVQDLKAALSKYMRALIKKNEIARKVIALEKIVHKKDRVERQSLPAPTVDLAETIEFLKKQIAVAVAQLKLKSAQIVLLAYRRHYALMNLFNHYNVKFFEDEMYRTEYKTVETRQQLLDDSEKKAGEFKQKIMQEIKNPHPVQDVVTRDFRESYVSALRYQVQTQEKACKAMWALRHFKENVAWKLPQRTEMYTTLFVELAEALENAKYASSHFESVLFKWFEALDSNEEHINCRRYKYEECKEEDRISKLKDELAALKNDAESIMMHSALFL